MKIQSIASIALLICASFFVACKSERPPEGPAEKAGAKVDEAGRDVKHAVKNGAEDTKESAEDTKNDLKK